MTLQLQEFITAIEKITINDDKGNKLILSDELVKHTFQIVNNIIHSNNKYTTFYNDFDSIFESFYLNEWFWNVENYQTVLFNDNSLKFIKNMEYIESCQTQNDIVDLPLFQKYCYYVTKSIIEEIIEIRRHSL